MADATDLRTWAEAHEKAGSATARQVLAVLAECDRLGIEAALYREGCALMGATDAADYLARCARAKQP